MNRLAIVITHPIQYYVPVFQLLAQQCDLKVFYTWGEGGVEAKYDPDFRKAITWDIPLLSGYNYELLRNTAADPGSHHGGGIVNPELIEKISAFAPNAILIYGYIYRSHFKVMRHFKGKIPIWFRGDSTLIDPLPWYKELVKTLYLRWVYSFVDHAFYVGAQNESYFEKYGFKENQLIFAPHAVDNERFAQDRKAESVALRQSLGILEEDILILFAGKLEAKKNPELLLEAFVELNKEQRTKNKEQGEKSKEQRTMHLLFVGNGILEQDLKSQSSNLKSQIHFLDFQNQTQMPVVYHACDIFCLPSQGPGESWGLAINEAMAAGKAIVTSDQVGCATDLVKDGRNGFVFDKNNLTALRQQLQYFVVEPRLCLTFGDLSKNIISNWSFNHQVASFISKLNELH